MLSGADMSDYDRWLVSTKQISSLMNIFTYILSQTGKRKYPAYLYSVFRCFVEHKRHIQLRFDCLETYQKAMRSLIMNQLDKNNYTSDNVYIIKERKEGDISNLFRDQLLQIFTNVTTVTIHTGYYDHYMSNDTDNKYTFSLLSLLSLIAESRLEKLLVIGGEWLNWSSEYDWKQEPKDLIEQKYNQSGYSIKVELIESWGYKEYHCVIERQ